MTFYAVYRHRIAESRVLIICGFNFERENKNKKKSCFSFILATSGLNMVISEMGWQNQNEGHSQGENENQDYLNRDLNQTGFTRMI